MKKIISFYIPYIIFISVIFNSVLKHRGISYLYTIFIFIGTILMISTGIKKTSNKKTIYIYIYLLSMLIIFIIQFIVYNDVIREIKSLFIYLTMLIYWIIYFNKFEIDEFKFLLIKTLPLVYFIALLAFIQYFFSPSLFNFIDKTRTIEWATSSNNYQQYFRATSILTSPQIFGLFLALNIIIIISIKKYSNIFGIIPLLFAGLLSGNKSFFYIILLYFLYKIYNTNVKGVFKLTMMVLGVSLTIIFIFPENLNKIGAINRVIDFKKIKQQENKKGGRLDRYYSILISDTPFIGNGFGTKTDRSIRNLEVAESYIMQIISELGFFVLFSFLIFLFYSYRFAQKKLFEDIRILIFLIFFSMIIVHAFNSPVFFIFWGILVSSYSKEFQFNKGVQ